uniref:Uncharacterized protein n=1 Tax=Arundo donax TaxID=35708 RepID=A0A0A9A014_ARUDO
MTQHSSQPESYLRQFMKLALDSQPDSEFMQRINQ